MRARNEVPHERRKWKTIEEAKVGGCHPLTTVPRLHGPKRGTLE